MKTRPVCRPCLTVSRLSLLVGVALATTGALASGIDVVMLDTSDGAQSIGFKGTFDYDLETLPLAFSTNLDAFSKSEPLELPCDLGQLSVGVSFKNVSPKQLYIEWSGAVFRGDQKSPIKDSYGRAIVHIADGRLWQPGEIGNGGFIFVAPPPLLSWAADSIPAGVPLRLELAVRGYTSDDIDSERGGYSLANLAPETVLKNNRFRIWVERTCS